MNYVNDNIKEILKNMINVESLQGLKDLLIRADLLID